MLHLLKIDETKHLDELALMLLQIKFVKNVGYQIYLGRQDNYLISVTSIRGFFPVRTEQLIQKVETVSNSLNIRISHFPFQAKHGNALELKDNSSLTIDEILKILGIRTPDSNAVDIYSNSFEFSKTFKLPNIKQELVN